MKKILLILFLLIFVSGCSVEYYLKIDDLETYTYTEDIYLYSENESESEMAKEEKWPQNAYRNDPYISEEPMKIEGVKYYTKELFKEQKYSSLHYSFVFPSVSFQDAHSVSYCFQSFQKTFNEQTRTTHLETSSEFSCFKNYPFVSSVQLKIQINNPVLSHNADYVNNDTYIWSINSDNYQDRKIVLTYQGGAYEKIVQEVPKVSKDNGFFPALMIFLVFLIIVAILFFVNVKKQNEKRG